MAEHAQLAGLDMLQHGGRAGGDGVDLPAQQGDHGRAGAGEGNVREFAAADLGQDFHRHMHGAVVAGGAVVDGARAFACIVYKFLHALPGRFSAHGQHGRVGGVAGHGTQVVQAKHGRAAQHHIGLGQHGQ